MQQGFKIPNVRLGWPMGIPKEQPEISLSTGQIVLKFGDIVDMDVSCATGF